VGERAGHFVLVHAMLLFPIQPNFRCSMLMPSAVILFLRHDMMIVDFQHNISIFFFFSFLLTCVLRVEETVK